jgi:hypothetical protein
LKIQLFLLFHMDQDMTMIISILHGNLVGFDSIHLKSKEGCEIRKAVKPTKLFVYHL